LLVAALLSAAAPAPDPTSWLVYLGPFLPFGGLAVWWILSQQKQHQRELEGRDRHIERLEARVQELSDRAVTQAEQTLPVVEAATNLITRVAARLDGER
jgi:hypothetical protein